MVGNSARIRRSRVLTWLESHVSRATTPRPNAATQSSSSPTGLVGADSARSTPSPAATAKPIRPHTTCSTRKSCTDISSRGSVQAAAYGRRAAEDPLHAVRARAQHGTEHHGRRRARGGRSRTGERPRADAAARLGEVAQVGQHPDRQLGPPDRRHPRHHEQDPETDTGPQHDAPQCRRHDRIRRSVGSRPIRIISR